MQATQDNKTPSWVSDFDNLSLNDLLRLVWSFKPGDIAKDERPELADSTFPDGVNLITVGPAGAGKSSYINSLLSLFNPRTEVFQTHSELGTESMTGTVRLEGPYCLNDASAMELSESKISMEPSRTVIRLWTTMGCSSYTEGTELERKFLQVIKRCFLGQIKSGDYTGMLNSNDYNPLVKRRKQPVQKSEPKGIPYHLVFIMARYGVQSDADIANHLYCFLSKKNNIPAVVVVTRSDKNTSWDALHDVDPSALFFVENYIPNEKLSAIKSKRLLLPLLEAIKRVERNDVYWCAASESWGEKLSRNVSNYLTSKNLAKKAPNNVSNIPQNSAEGQEEEDDDNVLQDVPTSKVKVLPAHLVLALVLVTIMAIVAGVVSHI